MSDKMLAHLLPEDRKKLLQLIQRLSEESEARKLAEERLEASQAELRAALLRSRQLEETVARLEGQVTQGQSLLARLESQHAQLRLEHAELASEHRLLQQRFKDSLTVVTDLRRHFQQSRSQRKLQVLNGAREAVGLKPGPAEVSCFLERAEASLLDPTQDSLETRKSSGPPGVVASPGALEPWKQP